MPPDEAISRAECRLDVVACEDCLIYTLSAEQGVPLLKRMPNLGAALQLNMRCHPYNAFRTLVGSNGDAQTTIHGQ